jgi:hypothetical protein
LREFWPTTKQAKRVAQEVGALAGEQIAVEVRVHGTSPEAERLAAAIVE